MNSLSTLSINHWPLRTSVAFTNACANYLIDAADKALSGTPIPGTDIHWVRYIRSRAEIARDTARLAVISCNKRGESVTRRCIRHCLRACDSIAMELDGDQARLVNLELKEIITEFAKARNTLN